MKKIMLALLLAALPALCHAQDPYPAYLTQLASEINVLHPTQEWSYWGTETDAQGWTDYYLYEADNDSLHLTIHVPSSGAQLDVAFVGDSIMRGMPFATLRSDLATLNSSIGGEYCAEEAARIGEIIALGPKAIAVGCGTNDAFTYTTLTRQETAMQNIVDEAGSAGVPVVVATVPPFLRGIPQSGSISPVTIAQNIRTFNAWLRGQKWVIWDRWLAISYSEYSNYGIPVCYTTDGIHPIYCQNQMMAGFGYALGAAGWQK